MYEELGRPDAGAAAGDGARASGIQPPELIQGSLVPVPGRAVRQPTPDCRPMSTGPARRTESRTCSAMLMGCSTVVGIDAAHLVMSMGGMVAQAAALQYPDRVCSLTLISTTQGLTHASRRVTRRCSLGWTARSRPMRTSPSWRSTSRAVAGSRFEFDEQYYRNIVAADLARGMNSAVIAPSASSRIDDLAQSGCQRSSSTAPRIRSSPTTTPKSRQGHPHGDAGQVGGRATNNLRNWSRN